jgi:predicted transcriptional regulator of viral defense system
MAHTRFEQNQFQISSYFNNLEEKIWTYSELSEVLNINQDQWNLPMSMHLRKFIPLLVEKTKMQVIDMKFPSYPITRYVWGTKTSIFAVAASINEKAYFSHLSAMYLHGLINNTPKEIYINVEQKERPQSKTELTQESIDKALKNNPRVTQNCSVVNSYTINLLNGKQTANLGVINKDIAGIGIVSLSNIERTLIDIAVRPVYSGGVLNVLNAYKAAKGSISIELITDYLSKINHKYPYHQNIGFYLEKAGFAEETVAILDKIKKEFVFHLDYRMKNSKFSKKWNLYYPNIIT